MRRNGNTARQTGYPQTVDQTPQAYTVQHDFDGAATVTTTVVHALADATGIDVTEAEFTLNDYVDPDALDRLFAPKADGTPRSVGHVSFPVMGYQTTVYSTGQISIRPLQTQRQQG
jgi:hypothetical protein